MVSRPPGKHFPPSLNFLPHLLRVQYLSPLLSWINIQQPHLTSLASYSCRDRYHPPIRALASLMDFNHWRAQWSVYRMKWCSFSTIEYLISLSSSFQLRNTSGLLSPSTSCWMTPRPTPEASVCKMNGLLKTGLCRNGWVHTASLRSLKARSHSSIQCTVLAAEPFVRSFSTADRSVKVGMNFLYLSTRSTKPLSFLFVVGKVWIASIFPS